MLELGVIGHDPRVEGGLGLFDGVKALLAEELIAHRAVQSFNLAGGGRMVGRGETVLDAVVETDPVKEHGGGLGLVFAGEDTTVVRQDLLRWAVTLEGEQQSVTDRAGRGPLDQLSTHAVAAVVIDAGHAADRRAVTEIDPSDHVHLPHLHRTSALEAPVVLGATTTRCRHDELMTHECTVDRRATRGALTELVHQLRAQRARSPARVLTAHHHEARLDPRIHLRRARVATSDRPAPRVRRWRSG